MSRERWGTFSVADHLRSRPFVADVLFYDRLVIPYPPDESEKARWGDAKWNPDRLDLCLDLLKDRAVKVPWNEHNQDLFRIRYKEASSIAFDTKNIAEAQAKNIDAGYLTRLVLQQDSLPQLPTGVSKVRAVAAYPSLTHFKHDFTLDVKQTRREKLALLLAHEFIQPKRSGRSDLRLLEETIELSNTSEFADIRRKFNEWQEDIIEQGITDEKAIEEMAEYISKYKAIMKKGMGKVYKKYAFIVVPIAASLPFLPLSLGVAASGIISLASFYFFDREPNIYAGDSEPAAMFYTVQKQFGWH